MVGGSQVHLASLHAGPVVQADDPAHAVQAPQGLPDQAGVAGTLAPAGLHQRELLDGAHRHPAAQILALQRSPVGQAGLLRGVEFGPGRAERRQDHRVVLPFRGNPLRDVGGQLRALRRQHAGVEQADAPRGLRAVARQLVQQFLDAGRRGLGRRGVAALAAAGLGLPGRIAVGLEGAPGHVVRRRVPEGLAGAEDRFAEGLVVAQQGLVEHLPELRRQRVVHRPAGHHDAAHADADQVLRQAGRQPVALRCAAHHHAEVAAVQEHQLRHGFHGLDLGCRDQQPVRQHDPRAQGAVPVLQLVDTVGADVDEAEGLAEQRAEDLRGGGRFGTDQRHDRVAQPFHQLGERAGLGFGAGQVDRICQRAAVAAAEAGGKAAHARVADHQHRAARALAHP